MSAVGLLVIGDLACGFAQTGPQLYAFRAIAGIGNGGIACLTMIIVSDVVSLEDRGKLVIRSPFSDLTYLLVIGIRVS